MNGVGLQIEPFNWNLRRARERMGWSRRRLAQEANLSPYEVGAAESFKQRPTERVATRIAIALGEPIDHLFPEEIVRLKRESTAPIELQVPIESLSLLGGQATDDHALAHIESSEARQRVRELLSSMLSTLDPRVAQVIELRYGFDGEGVKSLGEVGRLLGLSRERARQLEADGLRWLRRPRHTIELRPIFDYGDVSDPG